MKVSRPRSPISSRVSKLSATKLGQATTNCFTSLLPKEIKVFSVEGVSHGTGPSFDWKLVLYFVLGIFRAAEMRSEVLIH